MFRMADISEILIKWLQNALKLKINVTTMLIAPEWNELASLALCRSKKENFLYRMAILEVKIE
jgi:hypothetical protein